MEVPEVLIKERPRPIHATNLPNLIGDDGNDDGNESIANVFCFGAFADKNSGIMYHNLMGSFPFMSYDSSICFFILYHYESNVILGTPIAGLDNISIFEAYKKQCENLAAKGFKPKLNVMDNQATKHIKKFLTKNNCKVQLVEPHNHRENAAERAIQTFKDAFIPALATTDSNFPLQLCDRLTPQVQDTLNMMRASRINPAILAYEALNGPYNWNRYPLAPLGCKAVVYEVGDTRGSWASRGVDAWYLGPSQDHYRCDVYYIPETRAYRISGSSESFPQHCQLPDMTPHRHLQELTNELNEMAIGIPDTPKRRQLLQQLEQGIKKLLAPPPTVEEQRVQEARTQGRTNGDQQYTHINNPMNNRCAQHHAIKKPNCEKGIKKDSKIPQASHKKYHTWDSTCANID
jgi:hypothetical protein